VRAARFEMRRAAKKERAASDPVASANRRLRLARRLAGHLSTTNASEATGLKRTTLSAHETGQNAISEKMAQLYGEAFGADGRWLRTGDLPSGYPSEIERRLPALVETYGQSDGNARADLESLFPLVKKDGLRLAEFERIAVEYMGAIGDSFRPVGRVFESTDPAPTTRRHRGPEGGHLLFRPIGLEIFTRIAIELAAEQSSPLPAAVGALRHIPVDLSEAPYAGVIWDTARHTMIPGGKRIAADLLRYMIGRFTGNEEDLLANYKRALGKGPDDRRVRLPGRIGLA
jgi:hypothetical protein